MHPYTVVLMLHSWENFSVYQVDADSPKEALAEAVAVALGSSIEEAERYVETEVSDYSIFAGTHDDLAPEAARGY